MNWTKVWMTIFGTSTFLNLDMGFWVSMGISLLVAISMIVVFWNTKPYQGNSDQTDRKA